jgi:hypothetical protein
LGLEGPTLGLDLAPPGLCTGHDGARGVDSRAFGRHFGDSDAGGRLAGGLERAGEENSRRAAMNEETMQSHCCAGAVVDAVRVGEGGGIEGGWMSRAGKRAWVFRGLTGAEYGIG